jgi:hypothetical protein
MKNEVKKDIKLPGRLTVESLQKLKSQGFRYVQVKGFTKDNHLDYMEPDYLILVPFKELPKGAELKEIYAPVDSKILKDWAGAPDVGIEVRVAAV